MQYSSLFISAVLSAGAMPLILNVAHTNKLYDSTGGRKIHTGQVPRLGGVGMFCVFFIVLALTPLLVGEPFAESFVARAPSLLPFVIGALLVHVIGLIDDLKGLPAKLKLAAQIAAALVVVLPGNKFAGLGYSADTLSGSLSLASTIVTVGWIVGVTNAFNLIDGLDGLAGGLALIACLAYAAFYYLGRDLLATYVCLTLAGAIVGFLLVNFPAPKAKMFMGDSGSLFLGFMMAVMPLLGRQAEPASSRIVGLGPAVLLLAIPVADTLRAMRRRMAAGVSIVTADRLHIHHLFFDAGYSQITILAVLYGASLMQAVVFVLASRVPGYIAIPLEAISVGILYIMFRFATSLPRKTE